MKLILHPISSETVSLKVKSVKVEDNLMEYTLPDGSFQVLWLEGVIKSYEIIPK